MKSIKYTSTFFPKIKLSVCVLFFLLSSKAFCQNNEQGSQLLFDFYFEKRKESINKFDSIVNNTAIEILETRNFKYLPELKWIRNSNLSPERFNSTDSSNNELLQGMEAYYLLTQDGINIDSYLETIKNINFTKQENLWQALFIYKAAYFFNRKRNYDKSIEVNDKLPPLLSASSYKPINYLWLKTNNLYNLGKRDSLRFYAEKAYSLAIDDDRKDPFAIADLAWSAGVFLQSSGAPEEASYYLENAVKYHLLSYGNNARAISKTAILADNFYYNWDLKKAEYYGSQALEIQNTLGKENVQLYDRSLLASCLTRIYLSKKRYAKAMVQIDPIVEECKKAYPQGSSLTVAMLKDKANVASGQGEYQLAENILLNAEEIAEKVNRLYTKTGVYNELSRLYEVMNLPEKALIYLKKEETLLREGNFYDSEIGAYNLVKKLHNYIIAENLKEAQNIGIALDKWIKKTKGESRVKLDAQIATQKLKLYEAKKLQTKESIIEAQDYSDALITTFIKDKSQLDLEGSKIFYGEIISRGLEDALEIAYINWESSHQESFYTTALRIMEINKSSTLLDGIKELSLNSLKNIPEHLKKLEIDLVNKRNKQESICNGTDDQSLCTNKIVRLTQRIDSITTVYKREYPDYYSARTLSLSEPITYYQSKFCDEKTMILEYAVFDDWIYRLDITKEHLNIKRFEKSESFDETLTQLRESLQNRAPYDTLLEKINFLLPTEIPSSIDKLLIVTDGNLSLIPFDILLHNESILISKYDISYAGSLQLLDEQRKLKTISDNSWLGFAPTYSDLLQIDNKTEINALQSITKGIAVIGSEATKTKFIDESPKFGILHLATHGELNNINPMNNKLVFSGKSENTLSLQEVYTLDLSAELAVLSACNTGNGKVEVGDGVMSLSRAFSYAGVASTVTSLWKVPDRETTRIMNLFYKHLHEGKSKANALRLAKQEYLKTVDDDPELAHPYYWAGFVLTGDSSSISFSNHSWIFSAILIGLLLLIGGYMLSRKRKKQR